MLQLVGTMASLYLPSLNADIIDKGVATGDTAYIWRTGGLMLGVTLVQIVCSIAAVYFGARAAMGFGRDVRGGDLPPGRPTSRPARSASFGAPSLITRITNDVQQVQMLVVMALHAARRRADHVRRRHHHGAARGRRAVLAPGRRGARCW